MIMCEIEIIKGSWNEHSKEIAAVRYAVFVKEQNVPVDLEQDGRDPDMFHVLARHCGEAVGTARMSRDGHIGRVSVLKSMRGRGIGILLMHKLEKLAVNAGILTLHLNAQVHAKNFYSALNYEEEGEIFEEAGIPHISMKKKLIKSS